MSGRGHATAAMLAGVAGGLVLSGSTTARWFAVDADRDVGGVPVPVEEGIAGSEVAGALLPLGVVSCVLALALVAAPTRARRAAGALLLLAAVGSAGAAARPFVGALPGAPSGGVVLAVAGALAVALAGALALRGDPPAGLPARYDLDADAVGDEWDLASADEPDPDVEGER